MSGLDVLAAALHGADIAAAIEAAGVLAQLTAASAGGSLVRVEARDTRTATQLLRLVDESRQAEQLVSAYFFFMRRRGENENANFFSASLPSGSRKLCRQSGDCRLSIRGKKAALCVCNRFFFVLQHNAILRVVRAVERLDSVNLFVNEQVSDEQNVFFNVLYLSYL